MQVSVVQFRPWAPLLKFGFDSAWFSPEKSPTQQGGIKPYLS
jgi:hypothetical protein